MKIKIRKIRKERLGRAASMRTPATIIRKKLNSGGLIEPAPPKVENSRDEP
jgi:hypothetical protein